jgi:hypothetical protein
VFVSEHDPNLTGNIAELKIAAAAVELGIPVLRPMTEHTRYDLVFEIGGRLLRVQCKSASRTGEVIVIRLVTNRRGPTGYIRTRYTEDEIDAVAAYCADLDECFLLPIGYFDGQAGMHLRLSTAEEWPARRATLRGRPSPAWGHSSVGRASDRQSEGRGFESHWLHLPRRILRRARGRR